MCRSRSSKFALRVAPHRTGAWNVSYPVCVFIAVLLLPALSSTALRAQPTAVRRDSVVQLPTTPALSVTLPGYWMGGARPSWVPGGCFVRPEAPLARRVITQPSLLATLPEPKGEWAMEATAALDAALPRRGLVLVAGAEAIDVPCGALHLRAYVWPASAPDAGHGEFGARAAAAIRSHGFEPVRHPTRDEGAWQVERVTWFGDRGDYWGIGTLEFWRRRVADEVVVLTFFWVDGDWPTHFTAERTWIMERVGPP